MKVESIVEPKTPSEVITPQPRVEDNVYLGSFQPFQFIYFVNWSWNKTTQHSNQPPLLLPPPSNVVNWKAFSNAYDRNGFPPPRDI